MLLDCLKQAEVGQRMLLAWVSFLALPTILRTSPLRSSKKFTKLATGQFEKDG
jgi:hypothetical protein